jgi:peptide/nickel transport system substrate-binding protein
MEAGMIQQWLLNLGIEVIPKLATWPELTSRAQTGDYDLIQLGIGFPPDPYAALYASFSSNMTAPSGEATPGTNYTRFRSEKVDKLLADAKLITDEAERQAAYKEIQKEIGASYCFLPMYNVGGHIPYYDGKGVSGWNLDYPIIRPQSMIEVYLTK